MRTILYVFLISSLSIPAQNHEKLVESTIVAKELRIQDNVERVLYDYTQSDEMGLIKMHAPLGWSEPIIKAKFEIRGIVLKGLLGLEYENGEQHIRSSDGFVIPKNTLVRIFNAGEEELILIEVLKPAYKKEFVKEYRRF